MTSLYIDSPSTGRHPIRLGPIIGQGLSGTVYKLVGDDGRIVKLYKEASELPEYRDKVEAMLRGPPNLPPFEFNGRTYVQIAWPSAAVVDSHGAFRGFAMPEIDIRAATELDNILQKSKRRQKGLPEFYGARVLLAANLSALMAELHSLDHYMVDLKPLNTMFYPNAWYMAILDTDGFSIGGRQRFPARQYSEEYIAPEANGKAVEHLGLEQDLFALAVIIFRLLNNGVHPYSGVSLGHSNLPTSLQERINAGLYAYGLGASKVVGPAPASIHDYFEDQTRRLFDRAFQQKGPRPSAVEWRDHLASLISNKVLVRCATNPQEHAHFSKGCGLCAFERNRASIIAAAARHRPTQSSGAVLGQLSTAPRARSAQTVRATASPVGPVPSSGKGGRFALITILAIVGFFFILAISGGNKTVSSTVVLPSQTTTKPAYGTSGTQRVEPEVKFQPSAPRKCVTFNNRQVCE